MADCSVCYTSESLECAKCRLPFCDFCDDLHHSCEKPKDSVKLVGILNANKVPADTFENVISVGIGPDADFILWSIEENRWVVCTFFDLWEYAQANKQKFGKVKTK